MRLYVTDVTMEKGRPMVLGLDYATRGSVCVRVKDFCLTSYLEPAFRSFVSEDTCWEFIRTTLMPWYADNGNVAPGHNIIPVRRRKLCGYGPSFWIARVKHASPYNQRRDAKIIQEDLGVCVYNHDVDPLLAFMHETKVRPFTYLDVVEYEGAQRRLSSCRTEVMARCVHLVPVSETEAETLVPMPLRVTSFDLETDGLRPTEGHEIRQIGIYAGHYPFSLSPEDAGLATKSILLSRFPLHMDPAPDYEVEVYSDEAQLMRRFVQLVRELDTIFLTGWNICGFDLSFVYDRCQILGCLGILQGLSWLQSRQVEGTRKKLSSDAFGHNDLFLLSTVGVHSIDGYILARKAQAQLKMQSFSLATFAKWIGQEKGDVTYAEMVEAFTTQDPVQVRAVADYCVQDCRLVLPILARMEEPEKSCAMSTLASVPISYVLNRGMQVLTWSLVMETAGRMKMVLNKFGSSSMHETRKVSWDEVRTLQNKACKKVPDVGEKVLAFYDQHKGWQEAKVVSRTEVCFEEGYEGATVIDPLTGYYADPVLVLDFKSLYPSCMLAYNVCLSTKVICTARTPQLEAKYPWPQYTIADIGKGRCVVFVRQDAQGVAVEGVIPGILTRLLAERQHVKHAMKSCAPGGVEYQQKNARQNAIKVSANSVYGYLGSTTTGIFAVDLAASVTSLGRQALEMTRAVVAEMMAAGEIPSSTQIVYGDTDSIMVCLPSTSLEDAERHAHAISKRATLAFPPPMELEFEMIMRPYLLISKKRYAGKSWSDAQTPGKVVIKGIATQRRDYPRIVQKAIQGVLDALLDSHDGQGAQRALDGVARIMKGLVERTTPVEELIVVKELNKGFAQPVVGLDVVEDEDDEDEEEEEEDVGARLMRGMRAVATAEGAVQSGDYKVDPPHVVVAKKMARRNPDGAPKSGDRISFMVVHHAGGGAGAKLNVSQRSEDPEYAARQGLKPDYGYYATMTASQVMELLSKAGLGAEGKRITQQAVHMATTTLPGQQQLHSFFEGAKRAASPVQPVAAAAVSASASSSSSSSSSSCVRPKKKQQTSMLHFFAPKK